jgi:hypothetical protein
MAYGKEQAEWRRTGHVLAVIVNAHRDPKKRSVQPRDMIPPYFINRTTETNAPEFSMTPSQLAKKLFK